MKLSIAALAIAVSIMAANVAVAQPGSWNSETFWRGAPDNPNQRIQFLRDRVGRGMADGSLDRHEADRVDHELDGVDHWIHQMHWEDAGRLTPDQRAQVQARLDGISRQIHWMRRDGF